MGIFLKAIGIVALVWFGLSAVGCAMLMRAVSAGVGKHGAPASSVTQQGRERDAVMAAMRDGEIDMGSLPSDLEGPSPVTVTFRDGSTHRLSGGPADRFVRAMLAARADAVHGPAYGGSSYSETAAQPHFKPGEPMVNPNPGASYDDD